jgi:hypothetical protein
MRTKTLLLASALTALSSAALMAQTNVYSLNAVGYINVTVLPGFNMIACQLQTTNNTLGSLISDAAANLDGSQAYKWNGSGFTSDTANSITSSFANNWTSGGVMTMNPGEAIWFKNPFKTNLTFTFVGTVPQGTLTTPIAGPNSFSMVSSQVPQAGDLATNLGYTNFNNGDQIYVFNPTNQTYSTFTVNTITGNTGYNQDFLNTGDPQLNVGQGFWYHTSATSAANSWTRAFNVNQ